MVSPIKKEKVFFIYKYRYIDVKIYTYIDILLYIVGYIEHVGHPEQTLPTKYRYMF